MEDNTTTVQFYEGDRDTWPCDFHKSAAPQWRPTRVPTSNCYCVFYEPDKIFYEAWMALELRQKIARAFSLRCCD